MDFYIATYKRQYYRDGQWHDSGFINQKIVILASSQISAENKVKDLISHVEDATGKNYRAVLTSGPKRVNALLFEECFDGGDEIRGI